MSMTKEKKVVYRALEGRLGGGFHGFFSIANSRWVVGEMTR